MKKLFFIFFLFLNLNCMDEKKETNKIASQEEGTVTQSFNEQESDGPDRKRKKNQCCCNLTPNQKLGIYSTIASLASGLITAFTTYYASKSDCK